MGDDGKVLSFVSEKQLEDLRATRGDRPEDGTLTVDRPLFEILQENKEKKDAEFNERFKNLPPKALDEDETEFLEAVEKQRKEMDKAVAEEEQRALTDFQAAIAGRTFGIPDLPRPSAKETTKTGQGAPPAVKRKEAPLIRVVIQPKKQKDDLRKGGLGSSRATPQIAVRSLKGTDTPVPLGSTGREDSSSQEGASAEREVSIGGQQTGGLQKQGREEVMEGKSRGGSNGGGTSLLGLGTYGSDDDEDEDE